MAVKIEERIVAAQELVYFEIAEQDDDLKDWVEQRDKLFVPFDEELYAIATEIIQEYPQNIKRRARFGADAFVVALAIQHDLIVVTEEEREGSSEKNPKIPYICERKGVSYFKFIDFMGEMGWAF